jgi:GTPase involved in cell partitioning and DNA repair
MPGSIRTGESQSVQHRRVEVGGVEGGEGGAGGDVGIADQSMHHRQLPRVIERKARDALSLGQGGGLSQFWSWPRSMKVSRMYCWAAG